MACTSAGVSALKRESRPGVAPARLPICQLGGDNLEPTNFAWQAQRLVNLAGVSSVMAPVIASMIWEGLHNG